MRIVSTVAAILMATAVAVAQPGPGPGRSQTTAPEPTAKTAAREVLATMDPSADPCQDFYQYACGGWLASTQLPPDRARWVRSFSAVNERNREVVRDLLEEAMADSDGDGDRRRIGRFYRTCMDEKAVEKAGTRPLAALLRSVRRVMDAKSLLAVTAELHRHNLGALFSGGVLPDFKNPTVNVAFLAQGGLGLPDRDYYLSDDDEKKTLREAYQKHVAHMLELLGEDTAAATAHAAEVVAFETRLARASRDRTAMRQVETLYNRLDLTGLKQLTPQLPWDAYLEALGRPGLADINVATPEFFTALQELVLATDPAVLRTYLRWQVVNGSAAILSADLVEANFDFFGRTLAGQQEMEPRWKRCVDATEGALGEAVGRVYVEKMFAGSSKEVALEMIQDIEAAFAADLQHLGWMDDTTRQRALEKLAAVTNKIGYPNRWRDDGSLRLGRKSYFANTMAVAAHEFDRELAKVSRPVDREEWDMPPQEVNAYYNPLGNEMVFPAGILQPPFFHHTFPAALNYGAIGGAIGHELTHGFDDQGRKFDAGGQLEEWWEPEVATRFEERAGCVEQLYSGFEVEPGLHLNGSLSLGENIADIGGLKQALSAYRLWEARHGSPPPVVEGLTNEQLLFVAWGQVWCTVMSPEIARLQVATDPHSPSRFRVNGPMASVPAFAEAFHCDPGTPMNPETRCEVW